MQLRLINKYSHDTFKGIESVMKNITLMSSDILLQYISKFSAIQDCSGPLSRTANPKILR